LEKRKAESQSKRDAAIIEKNIKEQIRLMEIKDAFISSS